MTEPDVSLEFIGTATTLLRLGPFTLLTDPNFLHRGERAYLGKGFWSKRITEPSLQPDGLPDLDAMLLSHLHGDHFDRRARSGLDSGLRMITTEPAADQLQKWGFTEAEGMQTWGTTSLDRDGISLRITSVPGVHAPGPARALLPPVMGTVLELQEPGHPQFRLYVSGDTLFRPWLRDVVDRIGPLDAAVLHLGGTRLMGITVTMDGRQGTDLLDLLTPRVAVPVHHDDYGVFKSPVSDFVLEAERRGHGDRVRTVRRGERVSLR